MIRKRKRRRPKFNIYNLLSAVMLLFVICMLNIRLIDFAYVKSDKTITTYSTKKYKAGDIKIEYPFFRVKSLDKKIKEYLKDLSANNIDLSYKANIIDGKYLSVLFYDDNHYYSYLLNASNLENIELKSLFKDEEVLNNKITEMLNLKYPKFVGEEALASRWAYLIENNKLTIYFPDISYTRVSIVLNYVEIKDIINFTHTLDKNYINENVFVLDPNKKTVAFTFDDGPRASTTNEIVTALKDNKANATFFMLGNKIRVNIDTVKNVLANGNEVGNHSFSHRYLTKLNNTKFDTELNRGPEVLTELTGETMKYTRPPYGSLSTKVKEKINTPIILWSLDTQDWKNRNPEVIRTRIMDTINDGDIILMHDIHTTTVEAVKNILPELYKNGYQVTSISKLLELKGITLENHKVYRKITSN